MKAARTTGILVCAFAALIGTADDMQPGRKADILKPAFQRQEQALLRLMDKWIADGMEYDVKIEEREVFPSKKFTLEKTTSFFHFVTLPAEIEQGIRGLNLVKMEGRLKMPGLVLKYSDNPQYSFAITVFYIATLSFRADGGWQGQTLDAIASKDRDGWDKESVKRMTAGYAPSLLYYYDWEVFSSCAIPDVYAAEVLESGSQAKGLKEKMHLCIDDDKRRLLDNRRDFVTWSRENNAGKKNYLPALMMGLFTVDGYAFDDGTGAYAMNERGKMLMDFIAEFPIPENATRLQAVMDGGNKDEIEGMMKKHGTEAKWKELLKKPTHPAFAKYPQD
ncbi:MAG: hypothetical protein FWG50_04115 [Kiritimatiellaeota bacterium]|nr:hypothetical protein [Kiritimatiellota bacterium]